MRWRWLDDLIVPALAVALEATWAAFVVAGLLDLAPAAGFAVAVAGIGLGAVVGEAARRRRAGAAPPFLIAPAVVLVAAVCVVLVGPDTPGRWGAAVAGALLVAGGAIALGVRIGGRDLVPEAVPGRAARAFAVVFVIVLAGKGSGRPIPGGAAGITATIVLSVLLLLAARLAATGRTVSVSRGARLFWVGTVTVGVALVVGAAALLGGALPAAVVLWPFAQVWRLIAYVAIGLGYALGMLLYLLLPLARRVLRLFGGPHTPPQLRNNSPALQPLRQGHPHGLVFAVLMAVVAVALLVVLMLLVKRIWPHHADTDVDEERESVWSADEALRAGGRRLRRVIGRVARAREARPRHPAEAVRSEYRRLERALARRGRERPPGASARRFLEDLAPRETGSEAEVAGGPALDAPAGILCGIYELARYSQHAVGWKDVERFREGAAALLAALPAAPA